MSAQEDTANSAARVKTCEKLLKEYPETEQAKTSQVDAALIASLPGTVEENVALIAQVSEQLRQHMKHKSNLIQSALCIVSGSYAAILRRGAAVPSGGSQSAAESLSLASSGHDTIFGITGAVIGDLLDNSVMDLSAGFYLGGVSEGLLSDDSSSRWHRKSRSDDSGVFGGLLGGSLGGLFDD